MNFKPARQFIFSNDKLSKKMFELPTPISSRALKVNEGEKKIKSKVFAVKSRVWLSSTSTPALLTIFDRAVMSACISEYLAGNKSTTPGIIYRTLAGKSNHYQSPTKKQCDQIMSSVTKLRDIDIKIDMQDVCKYFRYSGGKPLVIDYTPILPCHIDSGSLGGGESDYIISFDDVPPLLTVARAKNNQLITCDKSLLDIGEKHTGANITAVKFYVLSRVFDIVKHRLNNSITFDDVFKKCRLADSSRDIKATARSAIISLMENLQSGGVINSYKLIRQDGKFYSVEIKY